MASLSTGQRLKSSVCTTEIMVISGTDEDVNLTCGGALMGTENGGSVHPDYAQGSTVGKRYVDDTGKLELLCVKAGDGSLAVNGTLLKLKDAKKLPKTD